MKGLDTPVLLALLEGTPRARALVHALAGEELATTEVNLFEIELLGRRERGAGKERRLQALERLRRKLTVLPIDEETTRRAATLAASARQSAPEGTWLCLGAAEAHGCTEWITSAAGMPPPSSSRIKVTTIERWKSK
ncbi:MAG: PIN domain-containing protein [Thermoplasmata archaeon]|nr:PIN domain-containing protein [Thermoplasmata archaeon]